MGDAIIQGELTEAGLLTVLMDLYNNGEVGYLMSILGQVEYLRNSELPTGYDSVLAGPSYRVDNQNITGGNEGSGIDWSSIINNVVATIGNNIGTWIGGSDSGIVDNTGNTSVGNGGIQQELPKQDYTPYLIGIGGLLLIGVLVYALKGRK